MDLLQWAQFTSAWLMSKIRSRVDFRSETGATAVEYGIMVALIAAVIVLVVLFLGKQIKTGFCTVVTNLTAGGITGSGSSSC
ncbi:MAG: Flp family type IVb pilin [Actinomycetota bacterium]